MRSRDSSGGTFTETARRTQIVECAIETIAELGYHQASIRKIADRVDVAMSVVLYHFGNKDELVAAIVAELYRSLIAIMTPVVTAEATAGGQLAAHIRAHLDYIVTHRAHQVALMDIGSNYRSRSGARISELTVDLDPAELAQLASLELETIFRVGVDTGEFRTLSAESMATAVRGAIGGALLRSVADPEFDVAGYADDLITAFELATRADH